MTQIYNCKSIWNILQTKFLASSIISIANVFSMSSEASAVTAPNTLSNFSIKVVTDDQIDLSRSAPYDGGSPIT
ncbi:hypothetical protein NKOR_03960 [Candidatus Nitrosopumilus koreensis AR1]|uniref:Uncharacterized protein n=1 Tax=Candidatus Nitrosopumilus koreensis AR1 TaxID=1229908 RepID=K0B6B3_9ARCH|nr:hypothetical protein NKOR_03960 [Candidatus Nitrosopumilus koreensis AR1]